MSQTKEIKQGDGTEYPKDKPHILENSDGGKQAPARNAKGDGAATEPKSGDERNRTKRQSAPLH